MHSYTSAQEEYEREKTKLNHLSLQLEEIVRQKRNHLYDLLIGVPIVWGLTREWEGEYFIGGALYVAEDFNEEAFGRLTQERPLDLEHAAMFIR